MFLLIGSLDAADYARWRDQLAAHLPKDERLVLATEAHDLSAVTIAFVANPPPGSLAPYVNLRFIQSLWAGVDRLLADPALPPDVPLARLIDPDLTGAMVEAVVAHVLALHRQAPAYARQQAARDWRQRPQPLARNRSVGVLGLGELGSAAAHALATLDFAVAGWSRTPRHVDGVQCYTGADGLDALLARTEILVNLLPLTPNTAGILDRKLFAHLPRGAGLVNVARGGHLVEGDLLAALADGAVGDAILDVFPEEPLPPAHPFWAHPHVTVLPHVAAYSAPDSAARVAADNVAAFRAGRRVLGLVERTRGY